MDLFERDGIGAVSMAQVAAAAQVSPGNLYYWFPNKSELVRELFQRWTREATLQLPTVADPVPLLAALWTELGKQSPIAQRWAFFGRELPALLHLDSELAELYRRHHDAQVERYLAAFDTCVDAGLLRPPEQQNAEDERSRADFIEAIWVLAEAGTPFSEQLPQLNATRALRSVITPLLTTAGVAALQKDPQHD